MNVQNTTSSIQPDEQINLNKIAENSRYAEGPNSASVEYSFRVFQRFIRPGEILEMGPAEGIMTQHLVNLGFPLSVVEGSERFSSELAQRYPGISVNHSLFEDFEPAKRFQTIILGHVLEHVVDPKGLLGRVKNWLVPGGRILAAVPNARSLHRQAAVMMGLLRFEEELNETDRHHGHRRVYNPETFRNDFLAAGLSIEAFGGYWLKPLSNQQISDTWTPEMLDAFMMLGEWYPDIAGEIYIVANV